MPLIQEQDDITLPVLRSDVQLNESSPEPEGMPTWTLYDPAANKYYKIGWMEFECLARFSKVQTGKQLVSLLKKETTLDIDYQNVDDLVQFLIKNNLVRATGEGVAEYFESHRGRTDRPLWQRMVHGYLFFTLPLFKPHKFLTRTYPYISFLFTRYFMALVALLLGFGLFLSVQRADEMLTTFMSYLSFEGVVLFVVSTILIKIVHELGHAYTATKYGVPVTTIGIAFIVMYPILYTETTNAWKLESRRDRRYIAAAGLMTEMALASVALIAWHFLSPGILQSLCFMVAVVSLIASIAINLNPLMKFDGYYLFSDTVGIDNLQDRSFAFMKWRLRRILFGWDDPAPEAVSPERRRLFTVFGTAMCIYRFFLYLGIAIMVHHIFFKPLGLILMIVELVFFIGLPIWREMKVWIERAGDVVGNWHGRIVLGLAAALFLIFLMPVNRVVEIPAVLHAESYIRLYAPIAARVDRIEVAQGDTVQKGDTMFKLSSPDLDYNISIISRRLESLQEIRLSSQADPELARKRITIDSEIEKTRKELAGYMEIKSQLEVSAPFSGELKHLDPSLHVGQWVSRDLMLGLLVDSSKVKLSGYIREQDIERLKDSGKAKFYADYSPTETFDVVLKSYDETSIEEIFWAELSSLQNGPIPSERDAGGGIRPLPRYTFYPAEFELGEGAEKNSVPDFVARGTIEISATPQNAFKSLINKGISYFVTESGL